MAEPLWSGAHIGLCLYVGRLLQPLWEEPVIAPPGSGESVLESRIPSATLEVSQHHNESSPSSIIFSPVAIVTAWVCLEDVCKLVPALRMSN